MTTSLRKRQIGAEQRRALALLTNIPFGATEAVMFTHGFTRRTLSDLVRAGLATAERPAAGTGDKAGAPGRVRITAAGRSALDSTRC